MKNERLLSELINLSEQLGLEIREEKGDFNGGLCRIRNDNFIFLNRRHNLEKKIQVLAEALAAQPLEGRFLLPAVRDTLEKYGNGLNK